MYFKEISAKLIFSRSTVLDLGDSCKLKIILAAFKNDLIEEKDRKAKAMQFKNEKQCLKRMNDKDKTCQLTIVKNLSFLSASRSGPGPTFFPVATRLSCQQTIDKALSSPPTSHFGPGPTFFPVAASPSVAAKPSTSGSSTSGSSVSRSSPASSLVSARPFYLISSSTLGCVFCLVVFSSQAFITPK